MRRYSLIAVLIAILVAVIGGCVMDVSTGSVETTTAAVVGKHFEPERYDVRYETVTTKDGTTVTPHTVFVPAVYSLFTSAGRVDCGDSAFCQARVGDQVALSRLVGGVSGIRYQWTLISVNPTIEAR